MMEIEAKFLGVNRHRIGRDGDGVTTLAAFYGCPLRCRHCLNPHCFDSNFKCRVLTPETLLAEVMIDDLYFQATGGGITFGGGEPCLQSRFIEEFRRISNPVWKINIETCLNVATEHIERVAGFVNQFIIDIKDMDEAVYKAYTTVDNERVLYNLRYLSQLGLQDKCRIRLPHIPDYNAPCNIEHSKEILAGLGFADFDVFEYRRRINDAR
ncbi:MAG: radical SAM protein [Bacteroidales bacterium]|nr:radical SAM protein [Bacteroidales bacterium]